MAGTRLAMTVEGRQAKQPPDAADNMRRLVRLAAIR
jgi:hypothetical protein